MLSCLIQEPTSKMEMLLILWTVGIAVCDKLDRTYLPPPGSVAAGGYPVDLQLPFQFPKENYPSTSEPGTNVVTTSDSSSFKYPNIALGIDRQAPSVTPSYFLTNRPNIPASNIYNVATTTTYDLTQTSTFSPVQMIETTTEPATLVSQEYPSTYSAFDPNLSYDQFLSQKIIKPNKSPQTNRVSVSRDSVSKHPNENIDQSINFQPGYFHIQDGNNQQIPFLSSNVNEHASRQLVNIDGPKTEFASTHLSSTVITPDTFSNQTKQINYSTIKYGDDIDNMPRVSIPTAYSSYPDKYHNQKIYSTLHTPKMSDNINKNSQDFYKSLSTDFPPSSASRQTFIGTSGISTINPSFNMHFSTQHNIDVQSNRTQAGDDRNALIINYENILAPESFAYSFDTSNGIHVDESGTATNGVKARGSYSFTGEDGKIYNVEYTADENGFLPRGDHLPTAPPIPNAILKGIEEAEKNKKIGIIDDGSYDDAKYGHDRYQGLMSCVLQNQYNSFINNKPSIYENKQKTKTIGFDIVNLPANNARVLNNSKYEIDESFNSPDKPIIDDLLKKNTYRMEVDKPLHSTFNGANTLNEESLSAFDDKKVNNKPIKNVKDDIINITPRMDKTWASNAVSKLSGKLIPTDVHSQKEYNASNKNKVHHLGYEYNQPQNMFNDNDKSIFESRFTSIGRDEESRPDLKTYNERIAAKTFTTPNAANNFKTQNPKGNSQILKDSFNDTIKTPDNRKYVEVQNIDNDTTKPDIAPIHHRESGQIRAKEYIVPERMLSLEPNYSSTSEKPYFYQSPYTFIVKERARYPSSTLGSQYSESTTPFPSENSSLFIPSTYSTSYFQGTPTASQMSSTIRPSITYGEPTSGITSRPPGNIRITSGLDEVENSIISKVKPKTFSPTIIVRPEYQVGNSGNLKPAFEVSTEPSSNNIRIALRPQKLASQSSTKEVIGEDFSGPKQPSRFDPEYGYYY